MRSLLDPVKRHFEIQVLLECLPDIIVFQRFFGHIYLMFLEKSNLKYFANYLNTKHFGINSYANMSEEKKSFACLDIIIITSIDNKLILLVFW